ncbi:MAG: lysylphosphatidylglycerol synthase domain-containing protein [Chloroflexota bacterium]
MGLMIGASLLVLSYGVVRNWQQLLAFQWQLTFWPLPVAMLLYPVELALTVGVWRCIIGRMGGQSRWRQDLRIYCTANIARRLPTVVWFVAGRLYLYQELGVSKSISSLATVVEGVLVLFSGLLTLVMLAPLSGGMGALTPYTWLLALMALACMVVVLRPAFLKRAVDWLALRFGHGRTIANEVDYRHMLLWTACYVVVWAVGGLIVYLLVRMVHPLPWGRLPAVIAAWVGGGVVSHVALFLPGGLGLKELTMAALLSALVPMPIAIVIAVLTRIWFSLNELLWFVLTTRLR